MSDPLISAVCVTKNRPGFLALAVDLFRAQSWHRKELIVVDDSDLEHQLDLRRYPFIRHLKVENIDRGAKHDLGLEWAQGDILCYWDDDDYHGPGRLTRSALPIRDGGATLTGMTFDLILKLPDRHFYRFKPVNELPSDGSWAGNGLGECAWPNIHDATAMFSRSVLRHGLKHVGELRQKVHFMNGLAAKGEKLEVVDNRGSYVYVRHARNSWLFDEAGSLRRVEVPDAVPRHVLDRLEKASWQVQLMGGKV